MICLYETGLTYGTEWICTFKEIYIYLPLVYLNMQFTVCELMFVKTLN